MIFSSPIFLFLFLPLVLLGYFISRKIEIRNVFLLLASLFFYAWGEVFYVFILIFSILANYFFSVFIEKYKQDNRLRKLLLGLGIACNLSFLIYFKYANFIVDNLNWLITKLSIPQIDLSPIHLPIGISFFTFQAITYLVDIYRKRVPPQKNIFNTALYISLFPQLIAGPIVRYHDIADQIVRRKIDPDLISSGLQRLIFGLTKKVLIADPLGEVGDSVFALPVYELTSGLSWLGLVCFSLQIYFDFSAYSDMAIGLGRMFGFKILENFNYPYISQSIREFWRRWHISLSTWFRDYLYIPLGGNRVKPWRIYLNLSFVFLICGFWHGARWNFIFWGALHGVYLITERLGFQNILSRFWRPIRHTYALLLVMIAWVFFKAERLSYAFEYLAAMVGFGKGEGIEYMISTYLNKKIGLTLLAACILSMPIYQYFLKVGNNIMKHSIFQKSGRNLVLIPYYLFLCLLLLLSLSHIAAGTYSPFIYFRF